MILNPTHDIGLKDFPSEILDAYVRYKQGSRAIVSWLVQYGPNNYKGVKTLPIKELAALASRVANCISELPEIVHFHFKETIAARKRLSQFFRKTVRVSDDDVDTVNHEHFTTSLTQIYLDLCQQCQQCKNISHRNRTPMKDDMLETTARSVQNHYACLSIEDSSDGTTESHTTEPLSDCKYELSCRASDPIPDLDIENDEINNAIETASILEQIHQTYEAVTLCWKEAAGGGNHFSCASGCTNIAWTTLLDLDGRLRSIDPVVDLSRLQQKCRLFDGTSTNSSQTFTDLHNFLGSLVESDRAIQHYCKCSQLDLVAQCPSCVQRPSDYIQPIRRTGKSKNTTSSAAILDNVLHLICEPHLPVLFLNNSPILTQIKYLLTHRNDEPMAFRSTLALHLMTVSYKAYLTALPRSTAISNCRITALKLSQQTSSSLSLILNDPDSCPCQCPQTLAFHLSNLKTTMEAYSTHKCWDLYFQSPWVAGNHTIEMLDVLSYYGMHLFNYRHYIAAVLHTYNAMTQLASLIPVPILETLIETFQTTFFPGGRPTAHFKNSWARYTGARLKFTKGHNKRHPNRDSWCMAVPSHAAKLTAGLNINNLGTTNSKSPTPPAKFDYTLIDPLLRLKHLDWRIDNPHSLPPPKTNSCIVDTTPPTHPVLSALPTFNHHLKSTTTLSHAKIYLDCTRAIRRITAKLHTDPSELTNTKTCVCFAHTLLAGADRIVDARRLGKLDCWRKAEREVVDVVKEVLVEEMGGGNVDWFWEV